MTKNPYEYGKKELLKEPVQPLTDKHRELLFENKTFCMLPWMHIHVHPDGKAYNCCMNPMKNSIGYTKVQSLEEIWNNKPMRQIRQNMLDNVKSEGCSRCYEQEDSGFFSQRESSNKHFGHHVSLTDNTADDGSADMNLIYWDIRFSNLCNLKCRSCGHSFSSNWYDDQIKVIEKQYSKLSADHYKKENQRLIFTGRSVDDTYDQLVSHIDEVEQIYFAGGEPLIMEEHYRLLKLLVDKNLNHVRLIYNTNFTELTYKKTNVLDLWTQFESVSIGASLDAMGSLGEYVRKNTEWSKIERNREEMLKKCPNVDFYVSSTLSIMTVWQLPKFHRDWVDKGLIEPPALNVNILQDPAIFRIDVLPEKQKKDIKKAYMEHISWLQPLDHLTRATQGYLASIKFMMGDDKSHLLPEFWKRTLMLDDIRNEDIFEIIPELKEVYDENK